ncbi:MAG: ribonuclease III family protein [Thermoproteota archaeon]
MSSLGDAYVNFIYSLALSKNYGRPVGRKLNSSAPSIAVHKSGLRKLLPRRVDKHKQADAAEALTVYGWLSGAISIRESIDIMARERDLTDNLTTLIRTILERSKIS